MTNKWVGALGVAVAAGTLALAASPAMAAVGGPVSSSAAAWTPQIADSGTDGTVETVRQMVQCGNTMYAVGTFQNVKRYSTTVARSNAFSFNASTGVVSAWNPSITGAVVDSVALSADCSTAYLGGQFTAAGATAVKNIVAVNTTTGAVVSSFASNASARVATLTMAGNHLLAGGYFASINGSARGYLASLNPTTGRDDGYVNLNISGNYQYTDAGGSSSSSNATRIWNFSKSPDGTRLLAMGDFTSVGGTARRQIFMLDLASTSATVDAWYSPEFDQNCATVEPFWLQDASWAPDGSKIYIATTGYKPATGTGYRTSDPRGGLCDAAAAFPSTPAPVNHLWVNYTGCDSLFATAADSSTAYIGGHERWANNPNGCDGAGPGAVAAPGMAGLSPTTGLLSFNPTRARGQGADDMLVTSGGLWIASDNFDGSSACGVTSTGAPSYGHAGICYLPY